jgi:hypothetical protein
MIYYTNIHCKARIFLIIFRLSCHSKYQCLRHQKDVFGLSITRLFLLPLPRIINENWTDAEAD